MIGAEKDYRPGVAFYTGVMPVYFFTDRDLKGYMDAGKTVWGVLKRRNMTSDSNRVIYNYGKKRLVTNSKEAAK